MSQAQMVHYNYVHVHAWVEKFIRQLYKDNWRPDYIVGLTRGGLVPAVILSHAIDVPMHALKVSLRDQTDTESNCWMSEDAFHGKKILIVDDINDTGATLDWIIADWQSSCMPKNVQWQDVWGNTVRFAVCVDNLSSGFSRRVNYAAVEINKAEVDEWIVFPWEQS
jgi:hypoxanthine phosphoribosyltransferase